MTFTDYNELAIEPLRFPIGGKTYEIPPVMVSAGFRIEAAIAADTSLTDEGFGRDLLGSAYDELLGDNVPAVAVRRVLMACIADLQYGRPMAEIMWETGGDPQKLAELAAPESAPAKAKRVRKPRGEASNEVARG